MREPVEVEHRIAPSVGWKLQILARQGNVCARAGCEATEGLEFDHIVARGLGGKHALWNYEAICKPCHAVKTKADVAAIAKAKRREKKLTVGAERKPSRLQSRGFDKTLTRRFDNTVVSRQSRKDPT